MMLKLLGRLFGPTVPKVCQMGAFGKLQELTFLEADKGILIRGVCQEQASQIDAGRLGELISKILLSSGVFLNPSPLTLNLLESNRVEFNARAGCHRFRWLKLCRGPSPRSEWVEVSYCLEFGVSLRSLQEVDDLAVALVVGLGGVTHTGAHQLRLEDGLLVVEAKDRNNVQWWQ